METVKMTVCLVEREDQNAIDAKLCKQLCDLFILLKSIRLSQPIYISTFSYVILMNWSFILFRV